MSPPLTSFQISIISQSVTVRYPKDLSPSIVQSTLENVGFDVSSNADRSDVGSSNDTSEAVNQALADRRTKHIQQCLLCRQEELRVDCKPRIYRDPAFRVQDPVHNTAVEKPIGSNHISSVVSRHEKNDDGPFHVAISVGGMSCSSCSLTITQMVSELQGVSDVVVSVLGGSATVIVDDKRMVEVVIRTIEDCGFEAELISVESLSALDHSGLIRLRTLTLRIDGMFCQ